MSRRPSTISFLRALAAAAGMAMFLASCAGPRLEIADRPVGPTRVTRDLAGPAALSEPTRVVLRGEELLDLYQSDSPAAIRSLAGRYREQPSGSRRQALAEISSRHGDRLAEEQPMAALGYYLDAARLSEADAIAAIGSEGEHPGRAIYNHSAGRVAGILHDQPAGAGGSITAPGNLQRWRLDLVRGHAQVDSRLYDTLVPCSHLRFRRFNWERTTQDGLGAAMFGHIEGTEERLAADPLMAKTGRGTPLNASFRFSGSSASLRLQDLLTNSSATVGGRKVPLAGDFSVALAAYYYNYKKDYNKFAGLMRPGDHEAAKVLRSLEAFRPDKTPLILVHGLMSSAGTWLPLINSLLADREVREKYQIYAFNYPTGNPITTNAADLRDALAAFRRFYDPRGTNPRMRRVVILGHSMGGIISNMQVRDSGDRIYRTVFDKDIEELGLDPEREAAVRRVAFYKANPDIDRAIFIAAPFRGSKMASSPVGRISNWIIRLPFNLVDAVLGDTDLHDHMTDTVLNIGVRPQHSVSSLRPDNPTLHDVLASPPRRGVEIHTIIAHKNERHPLEESGDGLVAYTSAHLDEAVSEKVVVGANHRSVVVDPESIVEVVRILHLHLGR